MTFVFQQPGSTALLDTLNSCSENANEGGGVFAFASKSGVDAIFGLPNLVAMLTAGRPFRLIVGIDAITNTEALLRLGEKVALYGNALSVAVFLHDMAQSTFHPKFSWFRQAGKTYLITGSGNLTERGLGKQPIGGAGAGNWEAFSMQLLAGDEADLAALEIQQWLTAQEAAGTLCSLDDSRVLDRAIANARVRYVNTRKSTTKPKVKMEVVEAATTAAIPAAVEEPIDTLEVLVRELPRTRGGQGDIGKQAHKEFFGHEGTDKHIFMQYVDLSDTLHPLKKVWLFYNAASNNYRLELPESKNNYEIGDNDERMLLVAVKLDPRSFRYTILRPIVDRAHYDNVSLLLGPIGEGTRRMRERFASVDDLLGVWDQAPSSLLPVQLPTAEP